MDRVSCRPCGAPVAPTRTFAFELPQARELTWLPLAVRFKLDGCGVRLHLHEWQALGLPQREALLACAPGERFRALLAALGHPPAPPQDHPAPRPAAAPCPPELAEWPAAPGRCTGAAWWSAASDFEHYLAVKVLQSVPPEQRGAAFAELGLPG